MVLSVFSKIAHMNLILKIIKEVFLSIKGILFVNLFNKPFSNMESVVKPNVKDVATYIVSKLGDLSAVKLQKLVYYSQAWSLVWDDESIFDSRIEAWVGGPVCVELYSSHRGLFKVSESILKGDKSKLSEKNTATIDDVLKFYGDKDSQWLSDLTHMEDPWITAREGLSPTQRGDNEITLASMHEYYSSL